MNLFLFEQLFEQQRKQMNVARHMTNLLSHRFLFCSRSMDVYRRLPTRWPKYPEVTFLLSWQPGRLQTPFLSADGVSW